MSDEEFETEFEIADHPYDEEHELKQENLTHLVDAALKKVESDRTSTATSFLPLSPSQGHSVSLASSRTPSMIIGQSYKTRSNLSTISNQSVNLNMELSMADSMEGWVNEEVQTKLLSLPSNLDSALILNRALQSRVQQTLHRLNHTLKENRQRQRDILLNRQQTVAPFSCEMKDSSRYFLRISSFCVPYFKDKYGRQPPRNSDSRFKIDNNYLDLHTTRKRPWLTRECNRLVEIVQKRWHYQLIDEWIQEKKEAECKLRNFDTLNNTGNTIKNGNESKTDLLDRIERCRCQLEILRGIDSHVIEIPPDSPIDWLHVAAEAFEGNRTTEECRLMWMNLCRPTLNQGNWLEEEDVAIQRFVESSANGKPDWQMISQNLPTNRSPFQIFKRWVSFIYPTLYPAKWTPVTTAKLIESVNLLKCGNIIPWSSVQQYMNGFSRVQLQSRWKLVDPEKTKGSFRADDDIILIKGLYKFGLNYEKISHFMPGRSGETCRRRFKRTILPGMCVIPWTSEEDNMIIESCQNGKRKWRLLSENLPGRASAEIQMRYHILQVWQYLSNSNEPPPPLFPVSSSTDAKEVNALRQEIIKEKPDLTFFMNCTRDPGILDQLKVNSLESRRIKLRQQKVKAVPRKIEKVTHCRGRKKGYVITSKTEWQDIEVSDYFLPGRMPRGQNHSNISIKIDRDMDIIRILGELFHLKIVDRISKAELSILKALNIDEADINAANYLCIDHNHDTSIRKVNNCPACEEPSCEELARLPPSLTTFSSFASIILHQRKLHQMASKMFLPYRFTEQQLISLGADPSITSTKRKDKKIFPPSEPTVNQQSEMPAEIDQKPIIDFKPGKIHITQGRPLINIKLRDFCLKNQNIATYTKTEKLPPLEVTVDDDGDETNLKETTLKYEHSVINSMETEKENSNLTSTEDQELKEHSEKLLFQRFSSLFFWPIVALTCSPSSEQIMGVNNDVQNNLTQNALKWNRNAIRKPIEPKSETRKLDLEDTVAAVKVMEQKLKERKKEKSKKKKSATSNDNDTWLEENPLICKEEESNEAQDLLDVEKPPAKKIRGSYSIDDLESSITDPKQVEEILSQKSKVLDACSKKKLIKLKRSLVIKKAWEDRRKGIIKPRKKFRDNVKYVPRSSRSRRGMTIKEENDPIPSTSNNSTTDLVKQK